MKRKSVAGPLIKGLIFAIVTLVATSFLALTIANTSVGATSSYYARFTDATGLNVGDDVRIAGVRVGQIQSISLVDRRIALVQFSVVSQRVLPAGVEAIIKWRNLVGQRFLELDQGPGPLNTVLPAGATIALDHTQPALDLTELFDGFRPLFQALSPGDVNQLTGEIIDVLQGDGGTVDSLVAHTASLATTLADKDKVIGAVIDNLNAVLNTVNGRGPELNNLIVTLQQLVSGLAQDRQPIGDAISALSSLTTSTAGLLQQGRAPLQADITSLGQLAGTLANNSGTVNTFLQNLPVKYQEIGTLASYGSWLNLYLCAATVNGVTENGSPVGGFPVTSARCSS